MWVFLSILFLLGFIHTVVNLTLIGKMRGKFLACLSVTGCIFVLFPLSARINIQRVNEYLSNFGSLSTACCYQVFESIVIMLISFLLIRNHYNHKDCFRWSILALIPSGIFLVGMFFMQTYLFNVIEEIPFWVISGSFVTAVFVLTFIFVLLVSKMIKEWEWQLELKIVLAFVQMLLAMFLPLVITRNRVLVTQFEISFVNSALPLLIMASILGLGFLRQRYFIKERLL